MSCCSSVTACATDVNCQCWTQCLANGGGNFCSQQCGQPDGATSQLFNCATTNCQSSCM
jgi:hypothetical protein